MDINWDVFTKEKK